MSDTDRKAAAIHPAGTKEDLAAAQQYRLALIQQGAAMRQTEAASQRASVRTTPGEDEAKARRAARLRS